MRHYNVKKGAVYIDTLAAGLGISERTVKRWIRKYLKAGIFTLGPSRSAAVSMKTGRRFLAAYEAKLKRRV